MGTKNFCATDEPEHAGGVHLASEPSSTLDFNVLPKVTPPSRPTGRDVITRGGVKEPLSRTSLKNLKLEIQHSHPQVNFSEGQVLSCLKKERREMEKTVFGYELILDLRDCDHKVITSRKKLKEYVDRLCKLIKMKKYGKPLIPYFGENAEYTKGYSLVQLIETSSITGHFSEFWNTAYINIFSCKEYDRELAKRFTVQFFKAKRVRNHFLIR
jgi:S-adenosylmethionine/arginine decarboxylase-like enzyme